MDFRGKKVLDSWLNDMGYYRKHVATDDTCFFRAVSDQVYYTQVYHEKLRQMCIDFAKEHRKEFEHLVENWYDHFDKLKKHLVSCGDVEMYILAKMLKRDFIVFNDTDLTIKNVTNLRFESQILLCRFKDNHFDSIFTKTQIDNAGFCQSLIYKSLYEDVFKFENVDSIVDTMLHTESEETKPSFNYNNVLDALIPFDDIKEEKSSSTDSDENFNEGSEKFPPFPYRVAKALDPNQYRNVEYDAWNQERKEVRIKDWYLGGTDFKNGTKCLFNLNNRLLDCYIQELNYENEEKSLIYIVELAEKRIVYKKDLQPVPGAKPWPVPYFISKYNKKVPVPFKENVTDNKVVVKKRESPPLKNIVTENVKPPEVLKEKPVIQTTSSMEGCPLYQHGNDFQLQMNKKNTIKESSCKNSSCNIDVFDCSTENFHEELNPCTDYLDQCLVPTQVDNNSTQNLNKCITSNENELPYQVGFECMRQNCWQMWLPVQGSGQAPYIPPEVIGQYLNQQTCVSAQYNMVQQLSDSKFTFYSQVIKETYNMNNNTLSIPNLNETPPSPKLDMYPYYYPPEAMMYQCCVRPTFIQSTAADVNYSHMEFVPAPGYGPSVMVPAVMPPALTAPTPPPPAPFPVQYYGPLPPYVRPVPYSPPINGNPGMVLNSVQGELFY